MIVRYFNTPLPLICHRSSRQKESQLETSEINYSINQDLTGIYIVLYPAVIQYAFFSAIHGTFSKIDHILQYKASLSIYKKSDITPCILSDHSGIKLGLNNKRNYRKYSETWKIKTILLNDQ
jgi:hypothetical protein